MARMAPTATDEPALTKPQALDKIGELEAQLAALKTQAADSPPFLDRVADARKKFWLDSGKQWGPGPNGTSIIVKDEPRNRVLPTVLRLSPEAFAAWSAFKAQTTLEDGFVDDPNKTDAQNAAARDKADKFHAAAHEGKFADMTVVEDANLHGPEAFSVE